MTQKGILKMAGYDHNIQKIPRFMDEETGTPYELYWYCTECGWAMTVNSYGIGKDSCRLCGGKTKKLRVDYPERTKDITKVLA